MTQRKRIRSVERILLNGPQTCYVSAVFLPLASGRQLDANRRSRPARTRHRDSAAVRFDDIPGNRHTEAAAECIGRVRAPVVALEDVRQFVRVDADTVH